MTLLMIAKVAVFLAAGAIGGYLLSRLLCSAGSCPITSNRPLMIFLGAMLALYGAYTANVFRTPGGSIQTIAGKPQLDTLLASASSRVVVVDFYADWCGPCHVLEPTLDELRAEWAGRAEFYRVDIDRSSDLARQFGVENIPLLVFFKDGQEVTRTLGLMSKSDLAAILTKAGTASPKDF